MHCVFTYKTPAGKIKSSVHGRCLTQAKVDEIIAHYKALGNTNITFRYY